MNTRKFHVTRLIDNSFAYENVLQHNKSDFDGKLETYIDCGGPIYKSLASDIKKGDIGIGNVQRNHFSLALSQEVYIKEVIPNEKPITKLTIKLSKLKVDDQLVIIHKDDFLNYIINRFKGFLFSSEQILVFDYPKFKLVGHILNSDGIIGKDTDFLILTDDFINIIDSSVISRDLFRDDFNFEEIGIGGLNNELANILRRALSSRAIKQSIIDKLGIKHVKGIILHGPPGTGKTLIARNIGKLLSDKPPTIINGPEILNKYVGQSEENLRNIFKDAISDYKLNGINSRLHIFIFDEIDAICKKRGRSGTQSTVTDSLVNQLLTLMDGVQSLPNIFLIAMTNRLDLIDDALIRPGRIEIIVKIGLPNRDGRMQIFRIHTEKMKNSSMMGDIDILDLSDRTENFSGAEIESVVKNASSYAIHELLVSNKKEINENDIIVTKDHFYRALNEIKPVFGNANIDIINMIPNEFKFISDNHKFIYDETTKYINQSIRLRTVLINGDPRIGKSTLVGKIAIDSKSKYIKIIKPIDVVRFDENEKSNYLTDIIIDAHISESSLIIFDDIEVLINFVDTGHNIVFSNKLYQTLITILKTVPENKNNTLTIICTTSSLRLVELFGKTFDKIYNL